MLKKFMPTAIAVMLIFALSSAPAFSAPPESSAEEESFEQIPAAQSGAGDETGNMVLWTAVAAGAVLTIIIITVLVTRNKNKKETGEL